MTEPRFTRFQIFAAIWVGQAGASVAHLTNNHSVCAEASLEVAVCRGWRDGVKQPREWERRRRT